MYKPQARVKRKQSARWFGCLAMVCRKLALPGWSATRGRAASSVDNQQRAWQLKKLSRAVAYSLVVVTFFSGAAWLSYSFLARSVIFQLTEIVVEGNKLASEQEIIERSGLKHGLNLLSLDIEQVANMVREHPWISRVAVTRHWPSSVEIQVTEHRPLALVNIEREGRSHLYYVNRQGVVFAPSTPSRDLDYPVLTGDALVDDMIGMQVAEGSLSSMAIDFLNLTAKGNQILPSQAVSEVHVSGEQGVVVYLVDHPFPIYMGKEKIRTRFNLLVRVLAQLYRQDKVKGVAEIRMDYAENKILVANTGT